ncbi:MAG: hypothetical protein ACKV22_22325 [Bryobacteraceae bacterium]
MPVEPTQSAAAETRPALQPVYRWYHKALALAFIIFCLEVGIILLVLPWSEWWDDNFFSSLAPMWPVWGDFWHNAYFRGAVSGLGIVNIYISFGEMVRLRRFSGG